MTAPSTDQIAAWWSAHAQRYHRWGPSRTAIRPTGRHDGWQQR
ncbi:MAG: hypothetical protein ACRDS0_16015 [Pseudonocardiaceae bacterium]